MTAPSRWILVLATALTVAGCSSPDTARPAPAKKASQRPTASPSSAFCLDLSTFQVGVVVFRGDAGKALEGQRLDIKDLKKRAAYLGFMGKSMRASAPPDIAPQFRTVLKAISTSASRLKPGAKVRDILDPLYGEHNKAAFDAIDHYACR